MTLSPANPGRELKLNLIMSTLASLVVGVAIAQNHGATAGFLTTALAISTLSLLCLLEHTLAVRRERREAQERAEWRKRFDADAPTRALRKAVAETILAQHAHSSNTNA